LFKELSRKATQSSIRSLNESGQQQEGEDSAKSGFQQEKDTSDAFVIHWIEIVAVQNQEHLLCNGVASPYYSI